MTAGTDNAASGHSVLEQTGRRQEARVRTQQISTDYPHFELKFPLCSKLKVIKEGLFLEEVQKHFRKSLP